jgi:hypothetical protein
MKATKDPCQVSLLELHGCSLTYDIMDQRPSWGVTSLLSSQEVTRLVRDPELYYFVDKNPPLAHLLNNINPVHTLRL